jgi:hypothetical protein
VNLYERLLELVPPKTTIEMPTLKGGPPKDWPHRELYTRVVDALFALPSLIKNTSGYLTGVPVKDLHAHTTVLGAVIEQRVTDELNNMRKVWDPYDQYKLYSFKRQAQVFPDVRLETSAPSQKDQILMGIELKGWFIMGNEGEPSFRYKVTPNACADADLLVVYPWVLSEVISGTPRLLDPFITEARYAAEYRNYYWLHTRRRAQSAPASRIIPGKHQSPYPWKKTPFNDRASDDESNFGRVGRAGPMVKYIHETMKQSVAGIPIHVWQKFFDMASEDVDESTIAKKIAKLKPLIANDNDEASGDVT